MIPRPLYPRERAPGAHWIGGCALNEHHAMKAYRGNADIAPHILDLGTRWK